MDSPAANTARVEASAARALELHRRGRLAEAVAAYREAVALAPDRAELHFNLGTTLHALGRLDDAIECYQQAIAREPALAVAHDNLGNALAARGDYDGAIASYGRALAVAPDHLPARYNLAVALQRCGRSDEAVAHYRTLILRSPAAAPVHHNLGLALMETGRVDEAVAAFERAAALRPDDADIRGNLAQAQLARGAVDEAIASLTTALARRPGDAELYNSLGNALDLKGDTARALAAYREALARKDSAELRANLGRAIATAPSLTLDPGLRVVLTRAMEEAWVRPADLARACGGAIDATAPVEALAQDALLIALLTRAPVRDAALERRLTALRRTWLAEALADDHDAAPAGLRLRCTLARQCFVNEYAFACDAEASDVAALCARLSQALLAGSAVRAATVAAVASYVPLFTVEGAPALLREPWPAPVAELIDQQIREPLAERQLEPTIPALTAIRSGVSERVRAQYEDNPYPRWVVAPRVPPQGPFNAWLRRRFPHAIVTPFSDDATPEMLVAGCGTGQEPLDLAQSFPDARVLAVDLSRASLAYAKRQTVALGVPNLTYAHADLLELPAQPRRFDVVSAVGVLHHLAEPEAGLRALCEVLRPGGLMRLGLYSARARGDVADARAFIAANGYGSDASSIRRCRQALLQDPAFRTVTSRADFWATSACRDLLFHVEEHDTDLPALADLLARHALRVVGVLLEPRVVRRYVAAFPEDPAAINLQRWHAFERAHPATFAGMYRVWVQKA